jgi:hypothetical protein
MMLIVLGERPDVWSVRWRSGFFHLQKKRIVVVVSHEQSQVCTSTHTAHPHDAMAYVHNVVTVEHEGSFGRKPLPILLQTPDDILARLVVHAGQNGWIFAQPPSAIVLRSAVFVSNFHGFLYSSIWSSPSSLMMSCAAGSSTPELSSLSCSLILTHAQ